MARLLFKVKRWLLVREAEMIAEEAAWEEVFSKPLYPNEYPGYYTEEF